MRILCLIALAAVVLGGCSGQPEEPTSATNTTAPSLTAAPDAGEFMPLTPGNHWTYRHTLSTMIIPDDGPPEPPEILEEEMYLDQLEYRTIADRTYVLERMTFSGGPGADQLLRRQDRAGYYLLDRIADAGKHVDRPVLSSSRRAQARRIAARYGFELGCVEAHFARIEEAVRVVRGLEATPPGGPVADEIQTLAYPLHPGATWTMRDAPSYWATVEGRERVAGVNAWRVRVENEFLNADDSIIYWYSRCGLVGWRFHLVSFAVCEDGTGLGMLISDDVAMLLDSRIDRGGCDFARGGNDDGLVEEERVLQELRLSR